MTILAEGDYRYGLRCMDCDRKIAVGDVYAKRLVGMLEDGTAVTETICGQCDLEAAVTA